jgi:hypothetical protein
VCVRFHFQAAQNLTNVSGATQHLDLSGSGKKGELLERLHEKATTIPIGALFESAIQP